MNSRLNGSRIESEFAAQAQKFLQRRMIFIISIKDAERKPRQVGYRNVAQLRIANPGYIRIQGVSEAGFDQSKGAFYAFREIALFRRQTGF